jgi:hypothetical protein
MNNKPLNVNQDASVSASGAKKNATLSDKKIQAPLTML